MMILRAAALSLFGACLAIAAWAQTGVSFEVVVNDPDAPVEVQSDMLQVERETGHAIFTGNVRVAQQDLRLSADWIKVIYDEETQQVQTVFAKGNVIYTSSQEEAEAEEAVYVPLTGDLEMMRNVLVVQETTAISGDHLDANLQTGDAVMTGNVKSIFGSQ